MLSMFALALVLLTSLPPTPVTPPVTPRVAARGPLGARKQSERPVAERIELPDGPCREAWEAGGATLAIGPPRASVPLTAVGTGGGDSCAGEISLDLSHGTWAKPETWCAWARLVQLARTPLDRDAQAARRWLARLALQQGRWRDAWAHFEHAGSKSELMLSFLPGIAPPGEAGAETGDGALPDGVLLTPAPPPPSADVLPGFVDVREAWVRGLRVGDAVLDMRIAIEPEGVQVDLEHVAGGTARLAVRLPEPEGLELRVTYVDWLRQDDVGLPLEVVVRPGDEPHSLYGRFLGRDLAWPTGTLERAPAAIRVGGLALVVDSDEPEHERLAGVCRALEDYGCRVTAHPPRSGVVFHVPPPGPERERKLAWLASACEALVLSSR